MYDTAYHQEAISFQEESDWARLANPAYMAHMLTLSPDELSSKIAMHLHEAASLYEQGFYRQTLPLFRSAWDIYTQAKIEEEGLSEMLTQLTLQACLKAEDFQAMAFFLTHYNLSTDPTTRAIAHLISAHDKAPSLIRQSDKDHLRLSALLLKHLGHSPLLEVDSATLSEVEINFKNGEYDLILEEPIFGAAATALKGDYSAALSQYNALPELPLERGMVYLLMGDKESALAEFRKASGDLTGLLLQEWITGPKNL